MSRYDFRTQRLFVRAPLAAGATVELDRGQANYLLNVLRMAHGDPLQLFNGTDGEWRARVEAGGRRSANLRVGARLREQPPAPDLDYLFAPLKQARLDYAIQKAVEMGVGRLRPVLTRHTQVHRLNLDRVEANVVEAAEQCGVLSLPAVSEPERLETLVETWAASDGGRRIVYCDEDEAGSDPLATLRAMPDAPLALLIGPEGGFADEERELLRSQPFVTPLALGPRILRADTAAVAALALIQAARGDWRA